MPAADGMKVRSAGVESSYNSSRPTSAWLETKKEEVELRGKKITGSWNNPPQGTS